MIFFKSSGPERFFQMHFIDGYYVDQQQVFTRVNLNESYYEANSSFYYKGDWNYTRVMEFNNVLQLDKCETELFMTLTDKKTDAKWDIAKPDHQDLKVSFTLISQHPCGFNISGESVIKGQQLLMPLVYLGTVALASLMNIASVWF